MQEVVAIIKEQQLKEVVEHSLYLFELAAFKVINFKFEVSMHQVVAWS